MWRSCTQLLSILITSAMAAGGAVAGTEAVTGAACLVVDLRDTTGNAQFELGGTPLLPTAEGEVRLSVSVKKAEAEGRLDVEGLVPASRFGDEYLTYVAWRIDEEGRFHAIGEVRRDKDRGRLALKVPRAVFGLVVTAEPYFAVPRPSDTVILEARPTARLARTLPPRPVACDLLPRGSYSMGRSPESLKLLFAADAKTPPELLQARNALEIARLSGAERFAKERIDEATRQLIHASALLLNKGERDDAAEAAAVAVTSAELARQVGLERAAREAAIARELEQAKREAAAAEKALAEMRQQREQEEKQRADAERKQKKEQARRETQLLDRLTVEDVTPRAAAPVPIAAAPPAGLAPGQRELMEAERRRLDEQRDSIRREMETLRSTLREEHERNMREATKQVQMQLELERARMDATLAEERAALKIEAARLESERKLLEAKAQSAAPPAVPVAPVPEKPAQVPNQPTAEPVKPAVAPAPTPVTTQVTPARPASAPAPASESAPTPVPAPVEPEAASEKPSAAAEATLTRPTVAPAPKQVTVEAAPPAVSGEAEKARKEQAAKADLDRMSAELAAEREAMEAEQAELQVLKAEMQKQLDATREREQVVAAKPAPEAKALPTLGEAAVRTEEEPEEAAEEPKRRWWFGKKKAADTVTTRDSDQVAVAAALPGPVTPEPVMPAVAPTGDLGAEWQRLEVEKARLAVEREALEARRAEAEQPVQEEPKRRWWFFGRKKGDPDAKPVAVEDPVLAAELSRIEAELEAEEARLAAERSAFEAQRAEHEAQMLRESKQTGTQPGPAPVTDREQEIERLNSRVAELERDLEAARARQSVDAAASAQQASLEATLTQARGELSALQAERRKLAETPVLTPLVPSGPQVAPVAISPAPPTAPAAQTVPAAQPVPAPSPALVPTPQEPIPTPDDAAQREFEQRLVMLLDARPSPHGLIVRLPDLSFGTGQHDLRPEAREQLARVAGVLLAEPGVKVQIEGHTDSTGDPAFNRRLSELRASAVVDYMARLGIPPSAMTAQGYGDSKPVAPNDTRAGRSQNRRVELIILTEPRNS